MIRFDALQSVLCLGAHADDIEIGCGGTILSLLTANPSLHVDWVVFSTTKIREKEARASFEAWSSGFDNVRLKTFAFEDTLFPVQLRELKAQMGELRDKHNPDVIFTHRLADAHQDHRTVAELTWNAFRDRLVFEYEIPKYEGDLGRPNFYVPLSKEIAERKLQLLMTEFDSQRTKPWYDDSTFRSIMNLRAIECRAASGFAEAFHANKMILR